MKKFEKERINTKMMTSRGTMTAKSWIPKLSQLTTLLLLVALCFGMISLSVAREQVDDVRVRMN